MPAGVHGGSLGRWFEQLCRIQFKELSEVTQEKVMRVKPHTIPSKGGVYAFWWTGSQKLLRSKQCNRDLVLHGPGGSEVHLLIDNQWLGLGTKLPIPLYVGKSARNISKRVGQHLMLSRARIFPKGKHIKKQKAPTTSCQLRAGIEHLFPEAADTRMLALENVGLSFVELDGDDYAASRFYLEDLAIGLMRPPLNVDVER